MKFTKMHGAGNDYIYINCFDEKVENPDKLAKELSDRHFGIGSDGLVLICPSDKADFRMDMYNSDGTQAEMCGNASRCVGKYVYDKGLTDKTTVTLETLSGIKTLDLNVTGGKVDTVKVNMGSPVFTPQEIPVVTELDKFIRQEIKVLGKEYEVTCISMGNPHAVVFMDNLDELDIDTLGPAFENHKLFPERINTEFVSPTDSHTLKMRVWERGAGETLACGTGACASLVASVLCGLAENEATLELLGGNLHIEWDINSNNVYMTGPAEFVFDGEL